jgi:hypothetical protein
MNIKDNKESSIDFIDAKDSQLVSLTSNSPSTTPVVSNFLPSSEAFWREKTQSIFYQKGLFLGRGDKSNILFQEFLKKFRKTIEVIIIEELKTSNHTSEGFKEDFKTLEHLFNMMLNHLATMNVEIKNEKTIAILHGFINSYISSIFNSDSNG